LAIELTGANCHDFTQALPLLDAIPPLQGLRGRPRCRPDCLLGDRAYDAEKIRCALRARHITPLLAMRNTENGSGLGRWRWVIERTFAWLNQFRRLRLRYEKRADMHKALLSLACALICRAFQSEAANEKIEARSFSWSITVARLLTESQHCNAIRMAAKRMEVQSPSPPRAACIFSSWEVGQSTVMRVPAVVPVTSTDGVPVPKTLVASKTLKSKLPL
jgi:transposase